MDMDSNKEPPILEAQLKIPKFKMINLDQVTNKIRIKANY